MGISLLGSLEARWKPLATWYQSTGGAGRTTGPSSGKTQRGQEDAAMALWLGLGGFLGRRYKMVLVQRQRRKVIQEWQGARNKSIREGRLQRDTRTILIRVMFQEGKGRCGGCQRHIRETASWQQVGILESVLLQSIPQHARKKIAPRLPRDPGLQQCQHTQPQGQHMRANIHTVALLFPSQSLG